jgi:pre-rRNA-processing protein TSR1
MNQEAPFGGPIKKRVPKGTSSYQAAWILEDDENGEEVDSDDDMVPAEEEDSEEEEKEEYEEINTDNRSIHFNDLDEEENAEQYLFSN